jgi:hypothetical protein
MPPIPVKFIQYLASELVRSTDKRPKISIVDMRNHVKVSGTCQGEVLAGLVPSVISGLHCQRAQSELIAEAVTNSNGRY